MGTQLNIAICEDQEADFKKLQADIKSSNIDVDCDVFYSGEELLETFSPGKYDLIFLDIFMNTLSGIEVGTEIRKVDENVVLVFTTSSLDYTLESYRLGALMYLEKPFSTKEVVNALKLSQVYRESVSTITLSLTRKKEKIKTDTILYFEIKDRAVRVITTCGTFKTSQSIKLSDIEQSLIFPPFYRCHHSFIVNFQYVHSISQDMNTFSMKNGDLVYIRRSDFKKAKALYENYLFQESRRLKNNQLIDSTF